MWGGAMKRLGKRLWLVAAAAILVGAIGVPAASASVAQPTHVPGAPSQVKAVAQNRGALVSWRAPATNGGSAVTGYVIKAYPGGKSVRTRAVKSFLVGGLKNGTSYTFTVAAVNKSGTGPASRRSAAIRPRAPTVPAAPHTVAAIAGFQQITVNWSAPASNGGAPVTGYRITTTPATKVVSATGDARSYTLTGLTNNTAYRVSVAAVNAVGRSKAAISAAVKPHLTVPSAPAGVTAAPGASSVRVSWLPPASTGGDPITGYVVTVVGTAQKVTAGPSDTSVTITGLSAS